MRAARPDARELPEKTARAAAKSGEAGGGGYGARGEKAGVRCASGGQKDTDAQFVGNRAISGLTRSRTFDKV